MKTFSLSTARCVIRRALAAALGADASIVKRDLQARRHEAHAGEVWLATKAELARRGMDADAWARRNLGVSARSMEHRAYLHKHCHSTKRRGCTPRRATCTGSSTRSR